MRRDPAYEFLHGVVLIFCSVALVVLVSLWLTGNLGPDVRKCHKCGNEGNEPRRPIKITYHPGTYLCNFKGRGEHLHMTCPCGWQWAADTKDRK